MRRPVAATVGALLDEIAERFPQHEVVVHRSGRSTYQDLRAEVDALARGLLAIGVGKGDHVAILMGNRPEWLRTWFALNKLGAVAVGISTWSSASEMRYILRHSDARLLVMERELRGRDFLAIVGEACPDLLDGRGPYHAADLPFLRRAIVVGAGTGDGFGTLDDIVEQGAELPEGLGAAAQREVRGGDLALLVYTSGSTGTPKGVQLLHRDMIENGFDIGEAEDFRPGDRFWLVLPLFWSAGNANTTMVAVTHGGTLVLQDSFEPEEALRLLSEERCTHYFAFPNVTKALFDHPARNRYPLTDARVAMSTGNPEGLRMLAELGFRTLLHPYGTTEDYGFATITAPGDSLDDIQVCQGRPLPGIEITIVDAESGDELGAGKPGEICIGGHVTPGYYKDEDKTQEAFDDRHRFHTGDLGFLDDLGRLHFLGRLRELIKVGGFNVAPAEVEAALLSHDGVAEAYVVGLPDALKGELVLAVVRTTDPNLSEDDLRAHMAAQLSSYKVPAEIRFRDSFPMTDTGKVSKKLIVEHELAARDS